MDNHFDRHQSIVLQFSGGKDSLACLYLLREYWDRIVVLWVNTGAAFPETVAQMEAIRKLVPHFVEVKSDQPANVAAEGQPSDLISWWDTRLGRSFHSGRSFKVQSPFQCCLANIWEPLDNATRALGATLIIRGQRGEDHRKGPMRDGMVHDGIEFWFPIEKWSGEQVRGFLTSQGVALPPNYAFVDSSLDCWSCTAYLDENEGKFRYMKDRHPELHGRAVAELDKLIAAAQSELDNFAKAMR